MARRPTKQVLLWALSVGMISLLIGVAILRVRDQRVQDQRGRDFLVKQNGESQDFTNLEQLDWLDIDPSLEGSCSDPTVALLALTASATTTNPPTQFLRGLIMLSLDNPRGALKAFQEAPVDAVPARFLYAPYRLQSELHPDELNAYRAPLLHAASQGQIPPLLEARIMVREAHLQQALNAYLRSDPSMWTDYDLELFPFLLQHSGLRLETREMLRAALRGGRVGGELRRKLETLAVGRTGPAATDTFQSNLTRLIQGGPDSQSLASRVAIRQLELRRQFLAKEYGPLLAQHAQLNPADQPDETVLLLTLSAAQEKNIVELDRWSQEIKRRFPEKEVEEWLQTLRVTNR